MKNYYDILGISEHASITEIRSAYRQLALKYHPDINTDEDAHETFIDINEAYSILSDAEKRLTYNRLYFAKAQDSSVSFDQYTTWQQTARENAERYSEMPVDDFERDMLPVLKRMYDVSRFIIQLIAISFFLIMLISRISSC